MKPSIFLFLSLSLCLFSFNSYAFKFSPMSVALEANENNSALFYLENDSNQPIAIQVTLTKREMNEDGVESNPKMNDELSVYPSQLIIQPNEKRSVKVTWLTKFVPVNELAYRLIAEQLPIDIEKTKAKKASIKVLLKYVAALYVTSDKFIAETSLKDFSIKDDKVTFIVENKGSEHQILGNLSLQFVSQKNKKEVLLKAEELKGMNGENVLAQSKRKFVFPRTGKLAELSSDDKVKINFDKN